MKILRQLSAFALFSFLVEHAGNLFAQETFLYATNGMVSYDTLGYRPGDTNGFSKPPSIVAVTNLITLNWPQLADFETNAFFVVTFRNLITNADKTISENGIQSYLLMKRDGSFSQFIVDQPVLEDALTPRNYYVLFIGNFAQSDNFTIYVQRLDLQRSLKYSLSSGFDWNQAVTREKPVSNVAGKTAYTLLRLERKTLYAPCILTISNDQAKYDYNFYRRDYVLFKLGIAGYLFNQNYGSTQLENSYLTGSAVFFLELHPFGGIQFNTLESYPVAPDDQARIDWFRLMRRLGVVVGTSVSLNNPPFDSIYLGLSYSITPDWSVEGGIVWYKITNQQRISFAAQEYNNPGPFIGFSTDLQSTISTLVSLLKLN
jgi:hypothetical protein